MEVEGAGLGISAKRQLSLYQMNQKPRPTRARAVRPYTTPPETTAMIYHKP
jgi:hypothetical protein